MANQASDRKNKKMSSDEYPSVHGSPFNRSPIPYGRQNITDDDIQAVVETLKSDYLTQGPKIAEFEEAFAKYVGAKYAVALANGTAALHLCALALEVKRDQKVITTPITFAASANCVRYCDGEVIFADIDPETYLLDIKSVKALLDSSPKGTYHGIIPVDFAGRAVDLEAFRKLADEHDLWIIEDACHAPGGYFNDSRGNKQLCGNGQFADLAIFSFHPVKHIASGEGGMITTNDETLYKKLLALRTHGITKEESNYQNSIEFAVGTEVSGERETVNGERETVNGERETVNGERETGNGERETGNGERERGNGSPFTAYPNWYMEMQTLGYNYRITDFQAALGISQLKRADEGLKRRREIAATYYEAFKDKSFIYGQSGVVEGHAYHLYVLEVDDRLGLYNHLREHKIFAQIHYIPCHLMPYYRQFGWKEGDRPHSENYYKRCISLPMYPTLTGEEQDFVIQTIKKYYKR